MVIHRITLSKCYDVKDESRWFVKLSGVCALILMPVIRIPFIGMKTFKSSG
jgi:hypothetical protein